MQTASELLGIPVPSDAPLFLMALGAHIAAGLSAVVAGAVAAFARKGRGTHPRAGLVYLWALLWVLVSSIVLSVVRWPHDVHLLVIGTIAAVSGAFGWISRLRSRGRWRELHLVAMGISYVALLTGFYVDNGPNLPGWRVLPRWSFWVLPAVIGTPIVLGALRRWRR